MTPSFPLPEPATDVESSRVKLLIIDDSELDRKLFKSLLQERCELDYQVHEAANVEDGLALCESLVPDCLLLDYELQGATGIDWIGDLKTRAGKSHLPIIMLTGIGDETLAVSAMQAGASDYLPKSKATAQALDRALKNAIQQAELRTSVDAERAQRELMHERLLQKNEELQSLYHTVSHELKTPLTAAREFVALMLDEVGGPLTPTQREFLETARGCCDRLAFLLNNWLDTVRSETGKLKLNLADAPLADVVRTAVKTYDVLAAKADIRLCGEIEDVGSITMDSERIQQTLTNLLSNAFKFTPAGGKVVVTCGTADEDVFISVCDTGRGIDLAHHDQVFSPFFQAEKRDTSEAKGMGLGLHVCRTIVELHGGRLTLESEVGSGATFTIFMPRQNRTHGEIEDG